MRTHHTPQPHVSHYLKHLAAGCTLWWLVACSGEGAEPGASEPPASSPGASALTVSTSVSGAGVISPSSGSVAPGGSASFTVSAANGYLIDAVSGCGGTLSGTAYTTGAVTAACTVTARFSAVPSTSSGDPVLHFSDLISGPDTGLGDGLGSGVIVTVWGQNLGNTQGANRIEYCDSASVCRAGHVYYWKNADGVRPSGPANLHASHGMQEIAFSIPDSALGAGTIRLTVGSDTSSLPFTVRAGSIFHVKSSGNNASNGSFATPWAEVVRSVGNGSPAPAGSTVYVHDVDTGSNSTARGIYFRNTAASSSLAAQFAVTAYPGFQPRSVGVIGVATYRTQGFVLSKMRVQAANCDEVTNGQRINCAAPDTNSVTSAIQTNAWGRTVANHVSEPPGRCSSSTNGAIAGNNMYGNYVEFHKLYGNEVTGYGCYGSSRLHHTTYMSLRDATNDATVQPWEWGWNYLHDNDAQNGIHNYDEDLNSDTDPRCGNLSGDLLIHDNVIVNQAGAGIFVSSGCGWTNNTRIYNNVIINAGLPGDWNGIDPADADAANTAGIGIGNGDYTVYIHNNTVHTWNRDESLTDGSRGCISFFNVPNAVNRVVVDENVCATPHDRFFIGYGYQPEPRRLANFSGAGNAFFYSGSPPATRAIPPTWDSRPLTADPRLTVSGPRISVGAGSPLINQSTTPLPRDIYGQRRGATSNVGAVQ